MKLEGSCQCGKVTFRCESATPYPFMVCHCSICRKTQGALSVNVMGTRASLVTTGKRYAKSYHAVIREKGKRDRRSEGTRTFCTECGTHLYVLDDRWPEGVWPNAAALDTELLAAPEVVHIFLDSKPEWIPTPGEGPRHAGYPPEDVSIAGWHEAHGLTKRVAKRKRPAKI